MYFLKIMYIISYHKSLSEDERNEFHVRYNNNRQYPAGLSAAIYAKRANLNVAVAEKEYEGTGR